MTGLIRNIYCEECGMALMVDSNGNMFHPDNKPTLGPNTYWIPCTFANRTFEPLRYALRELERDRGALVDPHIQGFRRLLPDERPEITAIENEWRDL